MRATASSEWSPALRMLVALAAFVVVIAGMRASQSIIVPFLLAGFITIILLGPFRWLQAKGLPDWVAMLVVIAVALFLVVLMGGLVGNSIDQFRQSLPRYQTRLDEYSAVIHLQLDKYGVVLPKSGMANELSPSRIMGLAGELLSSLGALLANGFIVLLYVVFMLGEMSGLTNKINNAFDDSSPMLHRVKLFTEGANKYMAIKAVISAFTGVLVAVFLYFVGVDFPILWGLLAGLLNFIPNIGSIFAAVPAVLLALVQLGPGAATVTAIGYVVINIVVGSMIEPRFMGQRVGLSTLVVFVSLVFWGWVLGPAGMLLSVPLTMLVKIGLDNRPDTRWVAALLS